MSTTTESGHARNAAHLEFVISHCTSLGQRYNPPQSAITIAGMQVMLQSAFASQEQLRLTRSGLAAATNDRELLFAELRKMLPRIIRMLEVNRVRAQTLADAKTIYRRLQGRRKSTPPSADASDPGTPATRRTISVSQLSYDSLVANFADLVRLITDEPAYSANEPELTVTGLNDMLTRLRASNSAVIAAQAAYNEALRARNVTFYGEGNSVYHTGRAAKKYVESLFGRRSTEYKPLAGIQFKKTYK